VAEDAWRQHGSRQQATRVVRDDVRECSSSSRLYVRTDSYGELRVVCGVYPATGLRLHKDKLDGYSFLFPEEWIPVTSTGADVFYRDIDDVETNVFVEFSSPSSSTYASLKEIGTPMQAAKRAEQQYLVEYMSTRIGVRRQTEVSRRMQRG